ncbi:MAG: hypothetical protein KDJ38_01130 [Gammaproteobacteria bacterium]|nr:hypothetical protein [Gammaproteobacteria bacterium]
MKKEAATRYGCGPSVRGNAALDVVKILFITFSKKGPLHMHLDPSVVYRCFNPAAVLSKRQNVVAVIHSSESHLADMQPDIVICHRPRAGKELDTVFRKFPQARMVADFDDLLFCRDTLDTHPASLSGRSSNSALLKSAGEYRQAAGRFNEFTVSTQPLKEHIEKQFPHSTCHIVNNGWGEDWLSMAGLIEARQKPRSRKKICYFAGTANHDQDLYQVSTQLREFLLENPAIDLEIFGSIDLGKFKAVESQVIKGRSVPFYLFPSIIKQAWVSIAPLIDTPFNQCKSAIKFIEAGLFGVPLIATPTDDLRRMQNDGLLFASQGDDWYLALNRLLDPDTHRSCSHASSEAALQQSAEYAMTHATISDAWAL